MVKDTPTVFFKVLAFALFFKLSSFCWQSGEKKSDGDHKKAIAEYFKPRAEWNAKWQIILENIAEAEGLKVEENELEELAKAEAEKTGISVAKLVKYYNDTNRIEVLLEEKVINFLKSNNKIVEVDADKKVKEKKGKQK